MVNFISINCLSLYYYYANYFTELFKFYFYFICKNKIIQVNLFKKHVKTL